MFLYLQLYGKNDGIFTIVYNESFKENGIEFEVSGEHVIRSIVPSYIPANFYRK